MCFKYPVTEYETEIDPQHPKQAGAIAGEQRGNSSHSTVLHSLAACCRVYLRGPASQCLYCASPYALLHSLCIVSACFTVTFHIVAVFCTPLHSCTHSDAYDAKDEHVMYVCATCIQKRTRAHALSFYIDLHAASCRSQRPAALAGRGGQNTSGSNPWPIGLLAARLNSVALSSELPVEANRPHLSYTTSRLHTEVRSSHVSEPASMTTVLECPCGEYFKTPSALVSPEEAQPESYDMPR